MGTGGDLKIIELAMKHKWEIPQAAFTEIPKTLYKIAKDGSNRDQVAAAKLLKSMNDANADHEPPTLKAPQVHLHADITGSLDGDSGNTGSKQLTVLERVRALLGQRGGTAADRVVVVEPEKQPTPVVSRRKPAAKDSRKGRKTPGRAARNRRDSSGK